MPTYEYACGECGRRTEHHCAYSDKPASVTCYCGSEAGSVISANRNSFVRNRPYEFNKPNKTVVNFGEKYGRSIDQQIDLYRGYISDMQSMVRSRGASKKPDIEWLGTMPGEMVDTIGLHEGDPEAVAKDPVNFLKRTGLYQGD